MRIGELGERAQVNPRTIRYYESIGVLPEPERTESGYRDYDETFVDRLTFVRTAQRLGMALDEVKEVLALRERGQAPCGYVRGVLQVQVATVDRRIEELQALRVQLSELVTVADTLTPTDTTVTCQLVEHARAEGAVPARPNAGHVSVLA